LAASTRFDLVAIADDSCHTHGWWTCDAIHAGRGELRSCVLAMAGNCSAGVASWALSVLERIVVTWPASRRAVRDRAFLPAGVGRVVGGSRNLERTTPCENGRWGRGRICLAV